MKKSNIEIRNSLTRFYKGGEENPYGDTEGNQKLYWEYERSFFETPNVFQSSNLSERFKDHMVKALDKLSEHYFSFNKVLKDYFESKV